ncbi:MAG: MltA domain-containing protein [Alphaproteobacteria bacterium]|nr:MltA domain-containing protein [Alphaproteobacteria bacterium]MCW5741094.1 MltA domain-containing protein [Alphaproteobacteria bacterium]
MALAALRRVFGVFGLVALAGCAGVGPGSERTTRPTLSAVSFAELPGWRDDILTDAAVAFRRSCPRLVAGGETRIAADNGEQRTTAADWKRVCDRAGQARDARSARAFFEQNFQTFAVTGQGVEVKYTAYYEPFLRGSKAPSRRFTIPVYRKPPDLQAGGAYLTRAEIESGGLRGKGLEIAWVEDPISLFEMQIQGGGRVLLAEGGSLRLGFDGTNNRPYTAIGKVLADEGAIPRDQVSAQSIRKWLQTNPQRSRDIMRRNERYVFFKDTRGAGPVGAQGVTLTSGRSLAIDAAVMPYGIPVWIDTLRPPARGGTSTPYRRLMVAQDTGGDIKGAGRGDIYLGSGNAVGQIAGRFNAGGRMFLLLPKKN